VRGANELRAKQIGVSHQDSLFPFGGGAVELPPVDPLFESDAFLSVDPDDSLDLDSDDLSEDLDSDDLDSDDFDSDDFDSLDELSPPSFLPALVGSAPRCAFLP
jgi:hypothetical protein